MRNVWGTDVPIRVQDFPVTPMLAARFRRCRCGESTFLNLPCRVCGNQKQELVFQAADNACRMDQLRFVLLSIVVVVVSCILLWLIFPPAILLAIVVAIAAILPAKAAGNRELLKCYWIFHQPGRKVTTFARTPMIDQKSMAEIVNAYDGDMAYLEHRLKNNPTSECAQEVFRQAESMAELYHNRRVSALMMRCLLLLPLEDGICLDVDQVCVHLRPEDLPDDKAALEKLYDCVRLTSLCPGKSTAQFVVRYCARRMQQAQLDRNPNKTVEETVEGPAMLIYFQPQERTWLATIWYYSSIGHTINSDAPQLKRWTTDPIFMKKCQMPLLEFQNQSNVMAEYWFDHVWYTNTGRAAEKFHELVEENGSDFAVQLAQKWGHPKQEEEE